MSSSVASPPPAAFESGASADHSNLQMKLDSLVDLPAVPTAAGYKLREFSPADRVGVSDLMVAAFGDAHGAWNPERVDAVLTNEPSVTKTFVLEQLSSGAIVATASARLLPERFPGAGYLHWVAVHPAHQSLGLGRLISLAVLHEFAGPLSQQSSVLETQDERLAAISCYERLGFKPVIVDAGQIKRWEVINDNRRKFREQANK